MKVDPYQRLLKLIQLVVAADRRSENHSATRMIRQKPHSPLIRYQRGAVWPQNMNPNKGEFKRFNSFKSSIRGVSSMADDTKQEKNLDPFSTLFALQSYQPKETSEKDLKAEIKQRSLTWNGTPRWTQSLWGGRARAVRRKLANAYIFILAGIKKG